MSDLRLQSASHVFVYLMVSSAPIPEGSKKWHSLCKIGISQKPNGRLASIKTASPFDVWLSHTWKLSGRKEAELIERTFHKDHSHMCISGEWFVGDSIGFASSIDYIILDHLVEKLGLSAEKALSVLISTGRTEEFARDVIISEYGEEVFA